MSKKLKAGIIGTGAIGEKHVKKYCDMAEDVQVIAVCDLKEEVAKRIAKENDIPHVFTNYKEMLEVNEIDIVDVCLPNSLHCVVTIDALNAGKHVYCEKPMATSSQETHKMVETARKVNRKLAVQMSSLFNPASRGAKQIVDSGVLGEIYYAKVSHYQRRGRSFVDGFGTPIFVQKKHCGGGVLIDWGVYHLALILWLLGNPEAETVTASTFQEIDMDEKRRKEAKYDVEEMATGFIRLAGGMTLFMEEAWATHTDKGEGLRVFGSKGGLHIDLGGSGGLRYFTDICGIEADANLHTEAYYLRQEQLDEGSEGYTCPQKHFVWGVMGRIPMIDTAVIGMRVVEISDAMYESARTRQEVVLGE